MKRENKCIVELFKIDFNKNELTIIKEPYMKDVVLKMTDEELDKIEKKYDYFKVSNEDGVMVFGQDLFDETNMSYHIRKKYNEEFGKYY